jgi:S-adenosylmethionine decarboxylase
MNRDHWLLYLTSPNAQPLLPSDNTLNNSSFRLSLPSLGQLTAPYQDTTLEILMSHLEPAGRLPFFHEETADGGFKTGHELGADLSAELGIDKLFSAEETRLDSFGFEPCGYSANAVIGTGSPIGRDGQPGGGYYTIHVTPEEGWSYASFECNVPLPSTSHQSNGHAGPSRPDLPTLIRNVVKIFQPNRLSITLFVSTTESGQTSEMEQKAWSAFGTEILGKAYERKDRIGYEFDGYDLVFACFERRGWVESRNGAGSITAT